MLLRTIPVARAIPAVAGVDGLRLGGRRFTWGSNNLPSAVGAEWMRCFAQYTAGPDDDCLHAMLRELHGIPQVLIVFNHPMWDLYKIGREAHIGGGGAVPAVERWFHPCAVS